MEFKDILRDLRKYKNITQAKLASEINFSLSTINKWENGKKLPGYDAIKILAIYFNVSADYLLGLEE